MNFGQGVKPDVSHLRIFGEPGYTHIPSTIWMQKILAFMERKDLIEENVTIKVYYLQQL